MRITRYMNQQASYEEALPRGLRGEINTLAARPIKCRKTTKNKWQRSKGELTLVEVTEILTETELKLGDVVDGLEIYAVEHLIDFDGSFIGCKAYPRPPLGFTP